MTFYCLLWLPSIFNFTLFGWVTGEAGLIPDGPLFCSYVILFFMGLFNVAVGCFASSLTSNQIIAAVIAFTFSVIHFLLGAILSNIASIKYSAKVNELIAYIASVNHMALFTSGQLDTRPLVYYATFAILFVFLTQKVLEYRRWKV